MPEEPARTQAPDPYTQAGITAAIRSYTTMLDEIAANWNPSHGSTTTRGCPFGEEVSGGGEVLEQGARTGRPSAVRSGIIKHVNQRL